MAEKTVTPTAPSAPPTWRPVWNIVTGGVTLRRVQAIVGTLAGIVTIGGALLSVSPLAQVFTTGELVATVQEAASHHPVNDATIEILTTQNQVVATLTPDKAGRASKDLREGVYVVRVSPPRYAAEVRRVQVLSRQTVEIHAVLRAGSSSSFGRTVNDDMRALRKAIHF